MKRLLIIKPSSMGDVLHAFPAVNALLRNQEEEFIVDWVIHPAFEELLDYLPLNGRRILFRRKELGSLKTFFGEMRSLAAALRQERYDAVLDLQGLFRSAFLGVLARSPLRYGPVNARETVAKLCYNRFLHTDPATAHAQEKNCDLIKSYLGGTGKITPFYTLPAVEKYVSAVDSIFRREGLASDQKFFAIAPGARWVTKQWSSENFAKSALLIAQRLPGKHFVLLGSPGEKELCARVKTALEGKVPCCDLSGKTSMGELVEVLRRTEFLLCNDSGPMHGAAASGTPLAAFFGPTDPVRTGPYCRNAVVLQPVMDCVNCFRKQCSACDCHNLISPELMAQKVLELWQQERNIL